MKAKITRNPRFSIVIPAYDEAAYIGKTLTSLSQQDYKGHVEIIVVDNNSTDETAAIAKKHGATVVHEKNPGVCWARQCGADSAKGEILISTDADTTFSKQWLSKIDSSFKNNPSAVAIAGPCRYVAGPAWGRGYARLLFGLVHMYHKLTGRTFYATATNIAFKKSAFTGYDTNLPQGGDELGLIRSLKHKGTVRFDISNPTYTSSRRLERGLIYNFFVTWLFFYVIEYNLNRVFKRSVLGSAPTFRDDLTPRKLLFIRIGLLCIIVLAVLFSHRQIINAAGYINTLR